MSFSVRYTPAARDDLRRMFEFLTERDLTAAKRAREAIGRSMDLLRDFPFSCRKATPENPLLRELIIPFGDTGYVALFEIENAETVTVLAVRHQLEDDFH